MQEPDPRDEERDPREDPEREGLLSHVSPRSGTEPVRARSAVRLRLLLGLLFTPLFIAGAVLFWAWAAASGPHDVPTDGSLRVIAVLFTALAVFSLLDLLVVQRRLLRARHRRGRRAGH
ncbi:hypothetical protein [Streptomyces sp. JJ38]|uniref:hypothetical protein n=1 Tax=Streptomyces sp. JJ38 TaxID=2738128 RepID=UPI00214B6D37|nr:hypothetical protein [Streptomyces sp. JJ38]